jgi:diguanylate cyclase (GGDEF)-like protein
MTTPQKASHQALLFSLLSACVLILVIGLAFFDWQTNNKAIGGVICLLLVMTLWVIYTRSEQKKANDIVIDYKNKEIDRLSQERDILAHELSQLGRYGNLLHGCTDLAEILQVSQQMLSVLLPGSAGSIYPLIDGEGLAEATHLWGIHVGQTTAQANHKDCWAIQRKRIHLSHSDTPRSACAHIRLPQGVDSMSAACIPLTAQDDSLGWVYLSANGQGAFPKLSLAVAACEQLGLALANLKLRQHLSDLSVRDPLTNLFNRRYLQESLDREIGRCKRRKMPLAMMVFDIDHFKALNDEHGHPAGDAVLIAFSRLLQQSTRDEDIACRLGGEEFILILPEMEQSTAERRAQEMLDAIRGMELMFDGKKLRDITASAGIAVFPMHGINAEQLIARSDSALYQAKNKGRDQYAVAE